MSESKIVSYSFKDLCALAREFKTQISEVSIVRNNSDTDFGDNDTFTVAMSGKVYVNGLALLMTLDLDGEVAVSKVSGSLQIPLSEGWRIMKEDFDRCCQLLVAPALFPLIRSAAASVLYSVGLPYSAIPNQISPFSSAGIQLNADFIEFNQHV